MKKMLIGSSMALVALTAMNATGATCPGGYTETSVSGSVSTVNISETEQAGTIELQLTKTNKSEKVLFDENGTIFGTVKGQTVDEFGRPVTILSHVITFEGGSTIETMGDEATITAPTSACSFLVEEAISNFWGTHTFKRATGEIRAEGGVSFPPYCDNQNQFELSGTICLFKGRH